MATTDDQFVTAKGFAQSLGEVGDGATAVDFVGDMYNKDYDMEGYTLMVLVVASDESYDPIGTAVVPMQFLDEVGQFTFDGNGYAPVRISGAGGLVTASEMNSGVVFRLYGIR